MALYIKGMEIPKNCNECRIKRELMYVNPTLCPVNASAHLLVANGMDAKQRREGCPLVEVKEPHGRLIDIDEFINHIDRVVVGGMDAILKAPCDRDDWMAGVHDTVRVMEDEPIVIGSEHK